MDGFKKFKEKIIKEVFIKSLIISCSISLLVTSIFIILCKIIPLHRNAFLEILLIIFSFIFSLYISYKLLMPTDQKIAKRIDISLNSKEKVQTMIEYQNNNSFISTIQKEDTLNLLKNTSIEKMPYKFHFKNFILSIIAILSLISTFFIKQKEFKTDANEETSSTENESTKESENSQNASEIIESLKQEIENENLDSSLKDKLNEDLDNLNDKLNDDSSNDEEIENTKDNINQDIEDSFSASSIGKELSKEDTTKELGDAISNSDVESVNTSLDKMRDSLKDLEGDSLKDALDDMANDIQNALKNSGVDESDSLYQALDNLANNLKDAENNVNDIDIQEKLDSIFEKAKEEIDDALEKQNNASSIQDKIEEALDGLKDDTSGDITSDISDFTNSEDTSGSNNQETSNDIEDESGSSIGGSGASKGDGSVIYAANDKIYDPKTNSYVTYGDLMDFYNSLAIEEISKGHYDEDLEALIAAYFSALNNENYDE